MIKLELTLTFTKIWATLMSIGILIFCFIYPEHAEIIMASTILPLSLTIINRQWQERKKIESEQNHKSNS